MSVGQPRRRAFSKKKRYSVLARDGFACRYCGASADSVKLEVDHIVPVSLGGTNDDENLITSCEACNRGKAARSPTTATPTPTDLARLAESVRRQEQAAALVVRAAASRRDIDQELCNLWCRIRQVESVSASTMRSLLMWYKDVGFERLERWITIAENRKPSWSDANLCRYIGGIRRMERNKSLAFDEDHVDWSGPEEGTTREATLDDR